MDRRNQAHVNVTHKEKQKAIISCIATLFIFLATGLVLSVLRGFLGELFSFDSDSIVIKNIFNISAYIISGVITCILVYKDSGISLKSAFSIKKIDFSIIIAGTFGIHALQDIILQCVALALSNNIHTDASNETSFTLVTIIELIFIAPIIEEIVFRFAEIELLRGKFKKVFICIVISFTFAICHGYGIQGITSMFTFSLFLCLIYYRFQNLVYPIAIHMFRNAIAFLYTDKIHFLGSPIAIKNNGFIVYSKPIIVIDVFILIAILIYAKLYYIPKYVKK